MRKVSIIIGLTVLFISVFLLAFKSASGKDRPESRNPENSINKFIQRTGVEKPVHYRNLTIFPVSLSKIEDRRNYLTLDEATRNGYLKITEIGEGNVNEVWAHNKSKREIFLMAGEILTGSKQNRMVADDCLLPAYSKIRLKVYCVEHGRWTKRTETFGSEGSAVHPMMRDEAKASKSQERVWEEVDRKAGSLGVPSSPTKDFQSVMGDKEVRASSKPYVDHFYNIPKLKRNSIGVVVAVGDRIICADLFANPEIFNKLWRKLLDSYVVDAIDKDPEECYITTYDAQRFLERVLDANITELNTEGLGTLVEISGNSVRGSSIIYTDGVVHLDLFPLSRRTFRNDPPNLEYRRNR